MWINRAQCESWAAEQWLSLSADANQLPEVAEMKGSWAHPCWACEAEWAVRYAKRNKKPLGTFPYINNDLEGRWLFLPEACYDDVYLPLFPSFPLDLCVCAPLCLTLSIRRMQQPQLVCALIKNMLLKWQIWCLLPRSQKKRIKYKETKYKPDQQNWYLLLAFTSQIISIPHLFLAKHFIMNSLWGIYAVDLIHKLYVNLSLNAKKRKIPSTSVLNKEYSLLCNY